MIETYKKITMLNHSLGDLILIKSIKIGFTH
jgi:hypothetical protein